MSDDSMREGFRAPSIEERTSRRVPTPDFSARTAYHGMVEANAPAGEDMNSFAERIRKADFDETQGELQLLKHVVDPDRLRIVKQHRREILVLARPYTRQVDNAVNQIQSTGIPYDQMVEDISNAGREDIYRNIDTSTLNDAQKQNCKQAVDASFEISAKAMNLALGKLMNVVSDDELQMFKDYEAYGNPPIGKLMVLARKSVDSWVVPPAVPAAAAPGAPQEVSFKAPKAPDHEPETEIKEYDNTFFSDKTLDEWGIPKAVWVYKLNEGKGWVPLDVVHMLNQIAFSGASPDESAFFDSDAFKSLESKKQLLFRYGAVPFMRLISDGPRKIADLVGVEGGDGGRLKGVNETFMASFFLYEDELKTPENNQKAQRIIGLIRAMSGYTVGNLTPEDEDFLESEMKYLDWIDPKKLHLGKHEVTMNVTERFRELRKATSSQEMKQQKEGLDDVCRAIAMEVGDEKDLGLARLVLEYCEIFGEPGLNFDIGRMIKQHGEMLSPDFVKSVSGRIGGDGVGSFLGVVDDEGNTLTDEEAESIGVLQIGMKVGGVCAAEALAKYGPVGELSIVANLGVSKLLGMWKGRQTILSVMDKISKITGRRDAASYLIKDTTIQEAVEKEVNTIRDATPLTLISGETYFRLIGKPIAQVNAEANKVISAKRKEAALDDAQSSMGIPIVSPLVELITSNVGIHKRNINGIVRAAKGLIGRK